MVIHRAHPLTVHMTRDATLDVVVHTTFASFFHGGQVKAELSADNALNKTFQFEPI